MLFVLSDSKSTGLMAKFTTHAGSRAVFEIYKRINSGGENLNDQQARKAAFW